MESQKAKRATKKKRAKSRKRVTVAKPLPSPVEPQSLNLPSPSEQVSNPSPNESGGMLAGLGDLLGLSPSPVVEQGREAAILSGVSSPGCSPDLSAEQESILAGVPDRIGGEADEPGGPADVPVSMAPAVPVVVTDKTAAAILTQFGALLASWRKFEEYKAWGLGAGESAGEYLASALNHAWARYAPLLLQSAEGSFPGLTAFVFAAGLPLVPVVIADLARASAAPLVRDERAAGPQRVAERAAGSSTSFVRD